MFTGFNSLERKEKRGTPAGLGFDPDDSTRTFHNLLAKREPNTRAFECRTVQAFENPENLRQVFGLNANAVVAHSEEPRTGIAPRVNPDKRAFSLRIIFLAILQGIPDQVLKELHEVDFRHLNRGKSTDLDRRPRAFDNRREVQKRRVYSRKRIRFG